MFGVAFGNNTFVAVGNSCKVWTSTNNGVTWAEQALSDTRGFGCPNDEEFNAVTYSGQNFVLVGSGGEIFASQNGITGWAKKTSPGGTGDSWFGVAFGNGEFVAYPSRSTSGKRDLRLWSRSILEKPTRSPRPSRKLTAIY